MIGTTLGHYRIDGVLGRGGMGEVYRAYDTRLNRVVAIKVIALQNAEGTELVYRFLREARAASDLNHPNIVTIHEIGRTGSGQHFMVQELIEGQTLRALLDQPLDLPRVAHFGKQLAKALAAAHAAGIVHRDIKPENIMVRPDGYLKLLDFGLARVVISEATATDVTISQTRSDPGTLLGTIAYMSPEQARGRTADAPSDVFSLGIVLYEMLTGRRPFTGDAPLLTLSAIINEHPAPPSRVNPAVPVPFDSLVMAMLSKDPATRPSAGHIDAELDRALGAVAIAAPPRVVAPRPTVGRDTERTMLLDAFQETAGGHGLLTAVVGEPGIGKTTLIEEVLGEIAAGPYGPVIARGKCSERLAGTEAYLPMLEVLDDLSQSGFGEMMRTLAPTWYAHVAQGDPESVVSQQIPAVAIGASQERLKRELAVLFHEISRVRPLVLFLDDLHWADVSTIDVLNYLAGRIGEARFLIIAAYRPSEMMLVKHPFLEVKLELQSHGVFRELPLDFLSRDDVERYLTLEFPGHTLPHAFGELIYEKTEGSPLFMADLIRYLRDRSVIVTEAGRWQLGRSMPDVARDLPETVKSTISRKIDRLDETDRKLLTAASVQGHEFDTIVISDVLGIDAADVEERVEGLDRVHGMVRAIGTYECPDGALTVRYRFIHVFYQNVLYASLQPTRRASLSRKVAQSLLAHHGVQASNLASELAMLYEVARDSANAAQHFLLATQHQMALFAFPEGAALARRGLAALEGLKGGVERTQLEMGLQVALAACLRAVEGWAAPSIEQIYLRVRDILEQVGDEQQVFPVRWGITLIQGVRGDLATWRIACEENLRRAEALDNPVFIVAACQMLGAALGFLGEVPASEALQARAASLYDPEHHQTYVDLFGLDPGMIARSLWSGVRAQLGRVDSGRDIAEETVAIARRQRQPVSLAFALCISTQVYQLRRERDRLLELSSEMIDLCRGLRLVQEVEWGRGFQSWAIGDRGDHDEAIAQARDALDRQLAIGSHTSRTAFLAILAEQLLFAGRAGEGLTVIDEAFEFRDRTGESYYVAELYRLQGELLKSRGALAEAEASFRAGLAFGHTSQALLFELRAATGLARLLRDRGDRAEARELLVGVYGRFTEGLATSDLREAAALIETLTRSWV